MVFGMMLVVIIVNGVRREKKRRKEKKLVLLLFVVRPPTKVKVSFVVAPAHRTSSRVRGVVLHQKN